MDKNLIHIDDLVRQRLNGEEEERAGAWLRMKDLLDKDMPNKAAGFAWRKTLVSAAVVVALATAGLTAYEMSSSFRGNAIGSNAEKAANPSFATNKATEKTNNTTANNTKSELPIVENQSNVNPNSGTTTVVTTTNDHSKSTNKTHSANKTTNANTSNNVIPAPSASVGKDVIAKNNNVNQPQQTTSPGTTTPNTTPDGNRKENNGGSLASVNPPSQGNQRSTPETAGTKMKEVPFETYNNKTSVDPLTGKETYTRELIDQGTTMVPVPSTPEVAALDPNKELSAPPKQFIPMGPPPDEFPSMLANNANSKHESKNAGKMTKGGKGWNFNAFKEFLDRADYQLGQTKINTGIVGGLNSTFGNYGMRGFNVGLYTNFVFNPFWSVKVEGKYVQRFNNNANTYDNDYTKYTPGTNGMFTQEEKRHFFKYSTASSLEMPIMLTYSNNSDKANHWKLFGGANLAYFFNIKAEETERTTVTGSVATAPATTSPMTLSDFNSRFGLGYVVGGGYQFNKQLGLDMRMTHMVSDNAKGKGAQQISKDLYKTPSLQLTLSYRFGANKKEN